MDDEEVVSTEPVDRLTRLCDAMLTALTDSPEFGEDVHGITMLNDGTSGGIVFHGYKGDNDPAVVTDLLIHLRALLRARGSDVVITTLPGGSLN
jgi:ketopantoate hydroxymethyltransferase